MLQAEYYRFYFNLSKYRFNFVILNSIATVQLFHSGIALCCFGRLGFNPFVLVSIVSPFLILNFSLLVLLTLAARARSISERMKSWYAALGL